MKVAEILIGKDQTPYDLCCLHVEIWATWAHWAVLTIFKRQSCDTRDVSRQKVWRKYRLTIRPAYRVWSPWISSLIFTQYRTEAVLFTDYHHKCEVVICTRPSGEDHRTVMTLSKSVRAWYFFYTTVQKLYLALVDSHADRNLAFPFHFQWDHQ